MRENGQGSLSDACSCRLEARQTAPKHLWLQLGAYGSCHSMLTISCVPASLSSSGESSGVSANQRPQ